MFRLEKLPRQILWNLEDELPFSWLLVQRDVWWSEAKQTFNRLGRELASAGFDNSDQLGRQQVLETLAGSVERIPGLETLSIDIGIRLEGDKLSRYFYEAEEQKLRDQRQEQIRLRVGLDDWPSGEGRHWWDTGA